MATLQLQSTSPPFDSPHLARSAAQVMAKASAMGLLEGLEFRTLDRATFREVVGRIASAGIGVEVQSALAATDFPGLDEMDDLLARLDRALEDSPSPVHEWQSLERILGIDRLGDLVGVSPQSVRRYRSGARSTPDPVAARLHFIATVVGELAGAYNDYGIRRWFQRPRTALDGRAPERILADGWTPDDPGALRVLALARSLTGSPAT